LAADTIGTGPRLQLMTDNPGLNRMVEEHFQRWADAVHLGDKLRTMRVARCQDGESFAVMVTDDDLPVPVKLDLQLLEAEQIQDPLDFSLDDNRIDGITVDQRGKPISYRVVTVHPGDPQGYLDEKAVEIKAADMIHLFRVDRPGLHRGIPEITPALPLFAQLRRYTLATIAAAETAANFSGVVQTDSPADDQVDTVEPLDVIEIERNALVTMPAGWKLGQFKAEQPATAYKDFKHEILNEIARALGMPFNIAAGNSAGYNYASGRLDHQTYFKSIRVDQDYVAKNALDRILYAWLREYVNLTQSFALLSTTWGLPAHQWFWDGMEHVDPSKEAVAQERRLKNHTTTLADEYAKRGKDWEKELTQRAEEVKKMKALGLLSDPIAGA
jgi:capsid protein